MSNFLTQLAARSMATPPVSQSTARTSGASIGQSSAQSGNQFGALSGIQSGNQPSVQSGNQPSAQSGIQPTVQPRIASVLFEPSIRQRHYQFESPLELETSSATLTDTTPQSPASPRRQSLEWQSSRLQSLLEPNLGDTEQTWLPIAHQPRSLMPAIAAPMTPMLEETLGTSAAPAEPATSQVSISDQAATIKRVEPLQQVVPVEPVQEDVDRRTNPSATPTPSIDASVNSLTPPLSLQSVAPSRKETSEAIPAVSAKTSSRLPVIGTESQYLVASRLELAQSEGVIPVPRGSSPSSDRVSVQSESAAMMSQAGRSPQVRSGAMLGRAEGVPQAVVPQTVVPQALRSQVMPQVRQPLPRLEQSVSQPTIQVTIGRIEIRAVAPPLASPSRSRPAATAPQLSLNEYLQSRSGG